MLISFSATSRSLLAGKQRFLRVVSSLLTLRFFRRSHKSPYHILGISRFASEEEIKRTYHRLMRRYHPDGIYRQTADSIAKAHRQALAINAAYETVMKKRGFKKRAA